MGGLARPKRATGPFDDKAKDRIIGLDRRQPAYISSGSEHSGLNDDLESPCLSDILFGFLEDDPGAHLSENESDSGSEPSMSDPTDVTEDLVYPTVARNADSFKDVLEARVTRALAVFSCLKSNKPVLRRKVMAVLRDCGYNAAICKTKWESCGGLAAGNYEFVDVIVRLVDGPGSGSQRRYLIDLEFAGEFEIARPSIQYERMLGGLPRVFVGRSEDLKQIVKAMSEAARRSLKSRGLHLPPWRKNRYMQNKWLGPCLRWPNATLSHPKPTPTVKCRSIGFHAVNEPFVCTTTS